MATKRNAMTALSSFGAALALAVVLWTPVGSAQAGLPSVEGVPKQALSVHVNAVLEALSNLGSPVSSADRKALKGAGAGKVQAILDKYAIAAVEIDANRKVNVSAATGGTVSIIKNGWTSFLVKVINNAGATDGVDVDAPESVPPYDFTRSQVEWSSYDNAFTDAMLEKHFHVGTTWGTWGGGYPYKEPPQPENPYEKTWPNHGPVPGFVHSKDRWAALELYQEAPLSKNLSGLKLEYLVLQVYSRDEGMRQANVSFNIGALRSSGTGSSPYTPGTPGFRGETQLRFDASAAVLVNVVAKDEDGSPTVARIRISDKRGRYYPHRAKRYAPDLFFQNHIYRYDGETIELPPGEYDLEIRRGPHHYVDNQTLSVKAGSSPTITANLKRWVNPQARGWTSNDKHVHTAGCMHYTDPTYGLEPKDMMRYAVGEDLDVADVMIWGPNWYYQKEKYFSPDHHPVSNDKNVVMHQLEISQFPSSAGGHTSGHGIKEIDFPGAERMFEWPSYTLPVLKWIQSQGGLSSYTHAGFGLDVQSEELPNYITPPMDSIGANEAIMTVTHGALDWIGVGNTNFISELNIFYHTTNAGQRMLIGGESDWPCINGEAIARGRSYIPTGAGRAVSYAEQLASINRAEHYVSDGRMHLFDFQVNGKGPSRIKGEEVNLSGPGTVKVTADVTAYLPETPETVQILPVPFGIESQASRYIPLPGGTHIDNAGVVTKIQDIPILGVSWRNIPWWHLERARIGDSRNVKLEVLVNGKSAGSTTITADGSMNKVSFDVKISQSSWIALSTRGAAHTNPAWVEVDNQPIRASRASVDWNIRALAQCYEIKRLGWRDEDYNEARAAYEYAYEVYAKALSQTTAP